ncbi:MAG: trypsin-like peptidase domain-containing protein [Eubacteriales bacterium]|nr:trypsin-like peptidase domain-containing protein [Desulforudis sp.]MDP3050516.1 trypsin-like peptidase domain-containing protein [Eubacteriales bacterium]MDQ7790224.1 trypsin-like peptidase domain-containing protein [Clostridia bacterium]MDZ7610776.1 trypsin-like peptidase domain-containing protein [Eubacteriales bacterium]
MFTDLHQAWYPHLIEQAAELGLVAGYPDGTFRPKEPLTREQLVYILLRYHARNLHHDTIVDLVAAWKRSVVLITNHKQDGGMTSGSGSFINDNGVILTNKHVVGNHKKLVVNWHSGQEFEAQFLRDSAGMFDQGSTLDLALIQIPAAGMKPVKLAEQEARHGEFCIVLGAPLALKDSATFGIVSHDDRGQFAQVDAAINPGNSGGACFDLAGRMIGVPTLKYAGALIDNMAYLTGVEAVKKFWEE